MSTSPLMRISRRVPSSSTSMRASSLIRLLPNPPAHPDHRSVGPRVDLHGVHQTPHQVQAPAAAVGRGRTPPPRVTNGQLHVAIHHGQVHLDVPLPAAVRVLDD